MGLSCLFLLGNHYAAQHIRTVAGRLDLTWKVFAAGLDERTAVLALSVLFHHKAEQYCDSVSSWAAACEATQPLPSDIQGLETAIRTHQSLYEAMCQAYTEVSLGRLKPSRIEDAYSCVFIALALSYRLLGWVQVAPLTIDDLRFDLFLFLIFVPFVCSGV